MAKRESYEWYTPLQGYLNDSMLSQETFAAIEAVLHLLITYADVPEAEKAYLLFSQYQLIGINQGSEADHKLQMARFTLGCYRSRKYWQDALEVYRFKKYDGIRAFQFVDEDGKCKVIKNGGTYPYSYEKRLQEWEKLWTNCICQKDEYPMAGAGKYYYYVSAREDEKKAEKVKVTFTEKTTFSSEKTAAIETRKIDSITITISELLDCAKEMKDMHPDDYCYNILQSNVVKAVNEGKVSECKELSVAQTVNIVGMVVGKNREPFLEVALNGFDIVIFDESDRVQKTLDQLFMPETSFNHYIQESAKDCEQYMQQSPSVREKDKASQEYHELQLRTTGVMSCLSTALNWNLGKWNKLSAGEPFSALALLDDLKKDESYKIPDHIYQQIYDLIDNEKAEELSSTLREALNISCMSTDFRQFNSLYNRWIEEEGPAFNRSHVKKNDVQDARLKLIICLIFFDHFIRKLSDAYTACHETSYGQNEIFGFLQTRFQDQQKYLPSALCGNLFGMKKNEQGDIVLFRQFAFGRSLMKDLPYLRLDSKGNTIGPHVIMLSGSSWAEGSYEYHINRPVNYILEADGDKREYLSKTMFFESGFTERVSGSGEARVEMLKKVVEKSVLDIIKEYNRNAGKILVIVNSYDQAKNVQETLQNILHKKQCAAKVCRMVSDATSFENMEGIIRRGEVSRFASMPADILVAPAMAIERGHNIVDETGHSALGAVFFMVRPMSVPDDIQEKGSKLNGYMEAHCQRRENESIWAYNVRMRQEATKRWSIVTGSAHYGLDYLDEDDQKDIVATLFILILQIFGRLARVTDTTKPAPHVYFMDGAFRKQPEAEQGFDCLNALGLYLDNMMQDEKNSEIAKTLYKPFYEAYKKGISYGR